MSEDRPTGSVSRRLDDGRVAIVTGAAGGIGQAVVRRLAADGLLVLATDRDGDRLEELVAKIPAGSVRPLLADLAETASRDTIIATATRYFGRVDVLVNNAADLGPRMPFLDYDWDAWDRVIRTNLTASAVLSQQVARPMAANGGGAIVNLTAIQERLPMPTYSAYAVTKGGISALTRQLAVELAELHIRVNAIAPGVIDAPTVVPASRPGAATLLGRSGHPSELAAAVAFLASDDASFITGTILTVDGGRTISRVADPLAEAVIALADQEAGA